MHTTHKRHISKFFWLLILLVALVYGPMAIEYFAHYFTPDAPKLWLHLYAWVTNESQAHGAGSVEVVQHTVYTHTRLSMLFHTIGGGERYSNGIPPILYALSKKVSAYTPSGRQGLCDYRRDLDDRQYVVPHCNRTEGVVAISRGQLKMHQTAMIFCFALLLSAPVLRIEWLIIPHLFDGMTNQSANFFSSMIFGYLVIPCAIAATRITDFRKSATQTESLSTLKTPDRWIIGASIIATIALVIKYTTQVGTLTTPAICMIILAIITLVGYLLAWVASVRAKNEFAIKEWRIHLLAYFCSPIVFLVFWQILGQFTTVYEAFEATSFTAPALTFAVGYLWVGISRHVKRKELTQQA